MSRAGLRTSEAHTHSSVCQTGQFLHDCISAGEKQSIQLKLEKISVKVWQMFLMCCSWLASYFVILCNFFRINLIVFRNYFKFDEIKTMLHWPFLTLCLLDKTHSFIYGSFVWGGSAPSSSSSSSIHSFIMRWELCVLERLFSAGGSVVWITAATITGTQSSFQSTFSSVRVQTIFMETWTAECTERNLVAFFWTDMKGFVCPSDAAERDRTFGLWSSNLLPAASLCCLEMFSISSQCGPWVRGAR